MREGTLKELNAKVGDKVRPVSNGSGFAVERGKLLVLTHVDHNYTSYKGKRVSHPEESPWPLCNQLIFRLEEEALSDEIKVGDEVEIYNDSSGKWNGGYTVLAIQDKDEYGSPERKWYVVAYKSDIPQAIKFRYVRKAKPKPVVTEVVMIGGFDHRNSWGFDEGQLNPDTHRITFNMVDGEPDCNSIKMEKL